MDFELFWSILDKITIFISIIGIPLSLWKLVAIERRRKVNLERIRKEPGNKPSILIVDLVNNVDIQAQIENYIAQREEFKGVDINDIHTIRRDKALSSDDVDKILDEVRKERASIISKGTDKIHFFYGGPWSIAAMIGSELTNGCSVVCYQLNNETKNYEVWGNL